MKRCGTLLLITLLFLSCRSPLHHDDLKRAALTVSADFGASGGASGRTVVPDIAGSIASITVSLTSGDGFSPPPPQTDSAAPWTVTFPAVPEGDWTVSVAAKNAGGDVIGTGSAPCPLEADTPLTLVVPMTFIAVGTTGDVSFAVSVPDSLGIDFASGELDGSGVPQAPALTAEAGRSAAVFLFTDLAPGTHTLVLTFRRGGSSGTVAGIFREKIVVRAGYTSALWVDADGNLAEERAFGEDEFYSPDAALSSLVVDGVLASSDFYPEMLSYGPIASLPDPITFTATARVTGQRLMYSWNDADFVEFRSGDSTGPLAPRAGTNVLKVQVSAPDRDDRSRNVYRVAFGEGRVVRYHGNDEDGGTVPGAVLYDAGTPVTVSGNSGGLTRSGGWGFSGWTENADGSGALYVPGKTFTMGAANVDLYARWRQIPGASWTERTVPGDMGGMNWQGITSAADGARIAAFANYPSGLYASNDGATWFKCSPAGTNDNTYWYDIDCSSDGSTLLAVSYGIYISHNWGATWVKPSVAGPGTWTCAAASQNGQTLAAGAKGGYVAISNDGGSTWISRMNDAGRNWVDVAVSADGQRIAACADSGGSIFTSVDGGNSWTERTAAGARDWYRISMSADGTKIAASVGSGQVWTSVDGGATWTERPTGFGSGFYSVAYSRDGSRLTVCTTYDAIRISTDNGASWSSCGAAGSRRWMGISASQDGTNISACVYGGGYIYTSANGGATWTERRGAGNRNWRAAASSADGQRLAACVYGGFVYTSADGGANWTERSGTAGQSWTALAASQDGIKLAAYSGSALSVFTSSNEGAGWTGHSISSTYNVFGLVASADGSRLFLGGGYSQPSTSSDGGASWAGIYLSLNWTGIACSQNGLAVAACVNNGFVHTSTDGGVSWTEQVGAGSRSWQGIASSADGTMLAGVTYPGYIYTSVDGGATWTERTGAGSRYWKSIASSADGMTLFAFALGSGYIYVSVDGGATWTERTGAGSRVWYGIACSSDGSRILACGENMVNVFTSP